MQSLVKKIVNKNSVIFVASLSAIALLIYLTFDGIKSLYFLQDEWMTLGSTISLGVKRILTFGTGSHVTILSSAFFYLEYKLFGLNHVEYIYVQLFLHLLASCGVYILNLYIFRNKFSSLLAAMIFASAYISHHVVTWIACYSTMLAAIIGIASVFFFSKFLIEVKNRNINIFMCYVFLFLGLLAKEDLIFLFVFYPLAVLLKKKSLFRYVLLNSVLFGVLYTIARFVVSGQTSYENVSDIGNNFLYVIRNMFTFTFSGFSQLFIPNNIFVFLSKWSLNFIKPVWLNNVSTDIYKFVAIAPFFNLVAIVFTFIILIFIFCYIVSSKNATKKINMIIAITFCFMSFLPFALVYNSTGLEGRHFYFPMVGGASILSFLIVKSFNLLKSPSGKVAIVLVVIAMFINSISMVRTYTKKVAELSYPRIKAATELESIFTNVPQKVLFLVKTDIPFFLPENPLPFQQGSGYTVMVLWHDKNDYSQLLKRRFLWDMGSQGYQEIDGIGFGFFTNEDLFLKEYKENNLEPGNVLSAYWDAKNMQLKDDTANIRNVLK